MPTMPHVRAHVNKHVVTQMMKALVLDSGALIKGGGRGEYERSADKVYAVKETVEKIKGSTTRQRLQVLPYQLELGEPSHKPYNMVSGVVWCQILSCVM